MKLSNTTIEAQASKTNEASASTVEKQKENKMATNQLPAEETKGYVPEESLTASTVRNAQSTSDKQVITPEAPNKELTDAAETSQTEVTACPEAQAVQVASFPSPYLLEEYETYEWGMWQTPWLNTDPQTTNDPLWREIRREFGQPGIDVEHIKEDAEKGDGESQYLLAQLYKYGLHRSISRRPRSFKKWLVKAANQGIPRAQRDLGCMIWSGDKNFAKDLVKAAELLKMAADSGDADCIYTYAFFLMRHTDKASLEEAFRIFNYCALEENHALSQLAIALCYEKGIGTKPDHDVAELYASESAVNGCAYGKLLYGLFLNEKGTSKKANHMIVEACRDIDDCWDFIYLEDIKIDTDHIQRIVQEHMSMLKKWHITPPANENQKRVEWLLAHPNALWKLVCKENPFAKYLYGVRLKEMGDFEAGDDYIEEAAEDGYELARILVTNP